MLTCGLYLPSVGYQKKIVAWGLVTVPARSFGARLADEICLYILKDTSSMRRLLLGIQGPDGADRPCQCAVVRSVSYRKHMQLNGVESPIDGFQAAVRSGTGDTVHLHTDAAMQTELVRFFPRFAMRETNTVQLEPLHSSHQVAFDNGARRMEWHLRAPTLHCFVWFAAESATGVWFPVVNLPEAPLPPLHTPQRGDCVYQPYPSVRPWCVLHHRPNTSGRARFVTWLPEETLQPTEVLDRRQLRSAVAKLREEGCEVQCVPMSQSRDRRRPPVCMPYRPYVYAVFSTGPAEAGLLPSLKPMRMPNWLYGFTGTYTTVRGFFCTICAVGDPVVPLGGAPVERPARQPLLPRRQPPHLLSMTRPAVQYPAEGVASAAEMEIDRRNRAMYGTEAEARATAQHAREAQALAMAAATAAEAEKRRWQLQYEACAEQLRLAQQEVDRLQDRDKECVQQLAGLQNDMVQLATDHDGCRTKLEGQKRDLEYHRKLAEGLKADLLRVAEYTEQLQRAKGGDREALELTLREVTRHLGVLGKAKREAQEALQTCQEKSGDADALRQTLAETAAALERQSAELMRVKQSMPAGSG